MVSTEANMITATTATAAIAETILRFIIFQVSKTLSESRGEENSSNPIQNSLPIDLRISIQYAM